jgi:hypothetical protein
LHANVSPTVEIVYPWFAWWFRFALYGLHLDVRPWTPPSPFQWRRANAGVISSATAVRSKENILQDIRHDYFNYFTITIVGFAYFTPFF